MKQLTAIIAIAAAVGCAHSAPTPAPKPATTSPTPRTRGGSGSSSTTNPSAAADELVTRTNAERRGQGLPALTKSVNLMRAAQIQADQMASRNQLDHDLPGAAYPTLTSRLAAVSYNMAAAGENIGEGYTSPADATAGWMGSSGHRANILSSKYTEIGTAVAVAKNGTRYWVQVFARPR
jgi:uncharacterized protein YkwD